MRINILVKQTRVWCCDYIAYMSGPSGLPNVISSALKPVGMADVPSESSPDADPNRSTEGATPPPPVQNDGGEGVVSNGEQVAGSTESGSMGASETTPEQGERSVPTVVGVDTADADDLLRVLSSSTARVVLEALHDDPSTASTLASRLDASLQTVHYHLRNLTDAGLIEVVKTTDAANGQPMDVYGPTSGPVIVYAGADTDGSDLQNALQQLLGGFGLLAFASLLVQELFGSGVISLFAALTDGPTPGGEVTTQSVAETLWFQPGIVFFAGGAIVLLFGFTVWYCNQSSTCSLR